MESIKIFAIVYEDDSKNYIHTMNIKWQIEIIRILLKTFFTLNKILFLIRPWT